MIATDPDPLHPIVLISRDADSTAYWTGVNGWTADRAAALEFDTFAAASLARRVARRLHPSTPIALERSAPTRPL